MPILRRTHARMCLPALGVMVAMLTPTSSRAGENPSSDDASVQSSWRPTPPTLSLQPEPARLFLSLPPEWLPPSESRSRLGPFELDEWLPIWRCTSSPDCVVCTSVGLNARLDVEDRSGLVGFRITVLPRAAVAELRFDPLPPWLR